MFALTFFLSTLSIQKPLMEPTESVHSLVGPACARPDPVIGAMCCGNGMPSNITKFGQAPELCPGLSTPTCQCTPCADWCTNRIMSLKNPDVVCGFMNNCTGCSFCTAKIDNSIFVNNVVVDKCYEKNCSVSPKDQEKCCSTQCSECLNSENGLGTTCIGCNSKFIRGNVNKWKSEANKTAPSQLRS